MSLWTCRAWKCQLGVLPRSSYPPRPCKMAWFLNEIQRLDIKAVAGSDVQWWKHLQVGQGPAPRLFVIPVTCPDTTHSIVVNRWNTQTVWWCEVPLVVTRAGVEFISSPRMWPWKVAIIDVLRNIHLCYHFMHNTAPAHKFKAMKKFLYDYDISI